MAKYSKELMTNIINELKVTNAKRTDLAKKYNVKPSAIHFWEKKLSYEANLQKDKDNQIDINTILPNKNSNKNISTSYQIALLENEKNQLISQIEELKLEINLLEESISSIRNENEKFKCHISNIDELQKAYEELKHEYEEMSGHYYKLEKEKIDEDNTLKFQLQETIEDRYIFKEFAKMLLEKDKRTKNKQKV